MTLAKYKLGTITYLQCLSYSALIFILYFSPTSFKIALLGETGPIEIISALGYFLAIPFFVLAAKSTVPPVKWHLLMWAGLAFLFFGEETSWMQHYLGFATPESIKEVNAQREFNLHNLNFFQGRRIIVDGQLQDFNWRKFLFSSQMLFQLGFVSYFFVIPTARLLPIIDNIFKRLGFVKPTKNQIAVLLVTLFVCVICTIMAKDDPRAKNFWAEFREMIFALGIFAFALNLFRQRKC